MRLGKIVRDKRYLLRIARTDLAKALGCSAEGLVSLEDGRTLPHTCNMEFLWKIHEILGISIRTLFKAYRDDRMEQIKEEQERFLLEEKGIKPPKTCRRRGNSLKET